VYHDFKDFWEIPQFLDRLVLGYRFYLQHFTIHGEETVLFAKTRQTLITAMKVNSCSSKISEQPANHFPSKVGDE